MNDLLQLPSMPTVGWSGGIIEDSEGERFDHRCNLAA
jgi:hypothetical protein